MLKLILEKAAELCIGTAIWTFILTLLIPFKWKIGKYKIRKTTFCTFMWSLRIYLIIFAFYIMFYNNDL